MPEHYHTQGTNPAFLREREAECARAHYSRCRLTFAIDRMSRCHHYSVLVVTLTLCSCHRPLPLLPTRRAATTETRLRGHWGRRCWLLSRTLMSPRSTSTLPGACTSTPGPRGGWRRRRYCRPTALRGS